MTVIPFEVLKSKFTIALNKSISKDLFKQNEINKIENYLNATPNPKKNKFLPASYPKINKTNQVFDLDVPDMSRAILIDSFHRIISNEDINEEKLRFENDAAFEFRLNVIEQTREFVKYYEWLKSPSQSKAISKISSLTHKQKVLALHYLGLQFKDHDYLQIARLIEPIINVGANDSRKYVQILAHEDETLKTKENLSTLLHMFDKESFTEQTKKIKRDLEKLE